MNHRGIVLMPDYLLDNFGVKYAFIDSDKTINDIRRHLLYWDKIELPNDPMIQNDLPREAAFLEQERIVSKTTLPPSEIAGQSLRERIINCNLEVFRRLEKREPGHWCIGQTGQAWELPRVAKAEARVVLFELFNSLPIPDSSEPLEEVLRFKQARSSELQALRTHLDESYQLIINSNNIPNQQNAAMERLQRSLGDLSRVAEEKWTTRLFQSVKIELNLPTLATGVAIGVATATKLLPNLNIPLALAGTIGIAASAIKISLSPDTFRDKLSDRLKPFAYLYKPQNT